MRATITLVLIIIALTIFFVSPETTAPEQNIVLDNFDTVVIDCGEIAGSQQGHYNKPKTDSSLPSHTQ